MASLGLTEKSTALFGVVDKIYQLLVDWGVSPSLSSTLDELISLALLFILAWLVNIFTKAVIYRIIVKFAHYTPIKWDDTFIKYGVFKHLIRIFPLIVVVVAAPIALRSSLAVSLLKKGAQIVIVYVILKAIGSATRALSEIFSTSKEYADKPLKVIFQIIAVFAYFTGSIVILSIIIDKSFSALFATLGASMAILMLIFKDTILGFVAGWQLSLNDMIRPGDWITMPKYNADGDVEDISLYSIKVRNFDKTITTIPPYALVSDSFQNWRGMQESGGRRVKRSVLIDMHSIKFCTPEMLEKFSKIAFLKEYIEKTEAEIVQYNLDYGFDNSTLVNGRRQTNIGVFRAYLTEYLKRHDQVSKELTAMVRQLQPNEKGIPIELYFFISNKNWVDYERIQSDIFDHVMAIVPTFELTIFQFPSNIPLIIDG